MKIEKQLKKRKFTQKNVSKKNEEIEVSNDLKTLNAKKHKSDDQIILLKKLYLQHKGEWNDQFFLELQEKTDISNKKLKKWFWHRKNKER